MTKIINVPGFIQVEKQSWNGTYVYTFTTCKDMAEYGYMFVCPYTMTFDLPEEFNLIAAEIAMLRAQKDKLQDEFTRKSGEIRDKITNLLCLEAPTKQAEVEAEIVPAPDFSPVADDDDIPF